MRPFDYRPAHSAAQAIELASGTYERRFLAGGTTLLDLMKCGVETPAMLIDIARLGELRQVMATSHRLRIGAAAKMAHVARDETVRKACPAVADSLWQAASPQLRNMASVGGNLLQRTRCAYFRDPQSFPACNKRVPESGCAAAGGVTRNHAVLGASDRCIATYPGDLAVVLTAFDAIVSIAGDGTRSVPIADFFLRPGDTPHAEHALAPGELITGIDVPLAPATRRSTYLKVRDRKSYEFAAASAAVGLELEPDGRTIRDVRVALGGVATVPWRVPAVEAALIGKTFDEAVIRTASRHAADGAVACGDNHFKIDLIPRVVARALLSLASR